MNHFRQKGMLRYSRKGIQVYEEALREYLRSRSGTVDFPELPRPADTTP